MQSSGGLSQAERCRGPHAILSGPAGGVIACARVSASLGGVPLIGLDMGGTSTDVCRFAGELDVRHEHELAGVRVRAPMLAVHTIAAGGGSVCRYDGYRLSVGPTSAGAHPGPLCYGQAEARELTLTDVNLALGRLLPDEFPFPLDAERVTLALSQLARSIDPDESRFRPLTVAEGFFEIANQSMADAVSEVSLKRGYDVRAHALLVFGGAGGQHACALVERLGLKEAIFHPLAPVLSAFGMALAELGWSGTRELPTPLLTPETVSALETPLLELERQGQRVLERDGAHRVAFQRRAELCYDGTDTCALLPWASAAELAEICRSLQSGPRHRHMSARRARVSGGACAPGQRLAHVQGQAAAIGLAVLSSQVHLVGDRLLAHRHQVGGRLRAQPQNRLSTGQIPDPDAREVIDSLHALLGGLP